MFWLYASPVVAAVADALPVRDRATGQLPRDPMSASFLAIGPKLAIAPYRESATPLKAAGLDTACLEPEAIDRLERSRQQSEVPDRSLHVEVDYQKIARTHSGSVPLSFAAKGMVSPTMPLLTFASVVPVYCIFGT